MPNKIKLYTLYQISMNQAVISCACRIPRLPGKIGAAAFSFWEMSSLFGEVP
jgi:hypothetical protein